MIITVEDLLKTNEKIFFVVTGTSMMFTEELQAFGGSSNVCLGAFQPYSYNLLAEFVHLGKEDKCVSLEVSQRMCDAAMTNFKLPADTIVVACTASLRRKEGEREGRFNGYYLTIKKNDIVDSKFVTFDEFCDDRYEQEFNVARDIVDSLINFVRTKLEVQTVPQVS